MLDKMCRVITHRGPDEQAVERNQSVAEDVVGKEAVRIFSDPFYRKGPNDQGIGWNVLTSLGRVGVGFGLAALVGIPLGLAIGSARVVARTSGPVLGLLRMISPRMRLAS